MSNRPRKEQIDTERDAKMLTLYLEWGIKGPALAKRFGITTQSVYAALKKAKILLDNGKQQ